MFRQTCGTIQPVELCQSRHGPKNRDEALDIDCNVPGKEMNTSDEAATRKQRLGKDATQTVVMPRDCAVGGVYSGCSDFQEGESPVILGVLEQHFPNLFPFDLATQALRLGVIRDNDVV